ncbi:MAG: class I SAM-dependent methyltransferase [Gammaproteobacteria bacterium]
MSYTEPVGHKSMLRDEVRNRCYRAALSRLLTPDSVVLDLGAGTGILGLMAASLGAARVYQVEPATPLEVSMELAEANGLGDKIVPLAGRIQEVELPEQVDVILSVFTGNFLLDEDLLPSLFYARDQYLKPGGVLLPDRARMWCAPVAMPGFYADMIDCWLDDQFGLSHAELRKYAVNTVYHQHFDLHPHELLAAPAMLQTIDFNLADEASCRASLQFRLSESAGIHGFLGWFDMQLDKNWLGTGPADEPTHWSQVFLPVDPVLRLEAGALLALEIDRPEFGEWSWRWQHGDQSAQHSVFLSRPFTPTALGRRAEGYQPQLSGQGEMAKWVLHHMDGSRTVADLAAGLVSDLGHPNPRQAETFVRHLIDGFGE